MEPIKIIPEHKWKHSKLGKVYTVNLEQNGLPANRKEFTRLLMGQDVIIYGELFKVTGIEAYAIGDEIGHEKIGIKVEEKINNIINCRLN